MSITVKEFLLPKPIMTVLSHSADQRVYRDFVGLYTNQKEHSRLAKIDETYSKKYQEMEIPVEVLEGQSDYFIEVVVLTKEEFQSLSKEFQ